LADDVAFFRSQVVLPLLESEKVLILVLHSYAGASVGGAVQALSLPERQRLGLQGGILGIICITTICVPVGLSIQDTLQMTDELAPWTAVDAENNSVSVKNDEIAIHQFYGHLPTPEAQKWVSLLRPQALETFKTKATYSPWTDAAWDGRTAFLLCEDDQSFPLQLQQFFVQSGNFRYVETLPSSHSPFLDLPEDTVKVLLKFASSFEGKI